MHLLVGSMVVAATAIAPVAAHATDDPVAALDGRGLGLAGPARDDAIRCMAEAIAYEAGHEPEAGQQAVAQVILNRLHQPAYPKTVCGVVYQGAERRTGCQFTFTCDGSLARWRPGASWPNAVRIATMAIDGGLPVGVGDATNYHADYVRPAWAAGLTRVAQIGAHIFYRPGAGGGAAPRLLTGTATPHSATLSVWGLPTALLTAVAGTVEVRHY